MLSILESDFKVFIDPRTEVNYCNFYLEGLHQFFGPHSVTFKRLNLDLSENNKRVFPILIRNINHEIKLIIDYADEQIINKKALHWCDIYGKINYFPREIDTDMMDKIVSLPPNFGIKKWGLLKSIIVAGTNFFKSYGEVTDKRKFFSPYYKQLKYNTILDYAKDSSSITKNNIFSMSTLWYSDDSVDNDSGVNLYRYNFFKACNLNSNINFRGGFIYSMKKNRNPMFNVFIVTDRVSHKEYLSSTKASILVFNTPAWGLCHGWKLGEFLALGKAIISTRLINELPYPLEHGKQIHYVTGTIESIESAIELITNNHKYRKTLEEGAYEYYLNFAQPKQVIKQMLNKLEISTNL